MRLQSQHPTIKDAKDNIMYPTIKYAKFSSFSLLIIVICFARSPREVMMMHFQENSWPDIEIMNGYFLE